MFSVLGPTMILLMVLLLLYHRTFWTWTRWKWCIPFSQKII